MSLLRKILGTIAVLVVIIYFGLPPTLRAMGFHPHHEITAFDLAGHRALIVTTSHDTLGETGRATGVFASEMTVQRDIAALHQEDAVPRGSLRRARY